MVHWHCFPATSQAFDILAKKSDTIWYNSVNSWQGLLELSSTLRRMIEGGVYKEPRDNLSNVKKNETPQVFQSAFSNIQKSAQSLEPGAIRQKYYAAIFDQSI